MLDFGDLQTEQQREQNNAFITMPMLNNTLQQLASQYQQQPAAASSAPAEDSLEARILNQEKWLGGEHDKYMSSLSGATEKYSGILERLAGMLNAPSSKVSFGLQGFDPMTVLPQSTLREASALDALAEKSRAAAMTVPLEQWGYSQQHTPYTGNLKYWDVINQLAQAEENRRYGIPSTTQTGSLTQGSVNPLTTLGVLGNLASTGMNIYNQGNKLGWWGSNAGDSWASSLPQG